MSTRFEVLPDCREPAREAAIEAASLAVRRGELVVLPTDTVYGVGADAFDPAAVRRLLKAKGRGPEMPPPVLVSAATTLDALAVGIPSYARALVEHFWPGPLTLVCTQQSSLQWDLGDTRGTVAVRSRISRTSSWSGIRTATVPRVSPRSHCSEDCWVQTRVSGPGQKCSTSARA